MDESISDLNNYISRLSLPSERFDELDACASTPEAVKAYLENLPHSNVAELCNRLYKLLPQIAGLKTSPGRKIALLDLATPVALDCVQRLTKNLAITSSNAKLLSLAIAMLKYLAEGYKSIVVAALRSSAAPPQLLTGACHSTVAVLRQILMDCWACYVPPPPGTWLELHTIHRIARIRDIDKSPVHRRFPGQLQDNSIRCSYVIPLMLDCADPGRHTPQDLRQIEYFLQTTAQLVDFEEIHSKGFFVIDPDTDRGPQYSFKADAADDRQFRLGTYRLVRFIEEELATGALSSLNERLARELCLYWSQEIQRREDPEVDNAPLEIVLGLSHIHRHLTHTRNLAEYLAQTRPDKKELSVLELATDNDAAGPRDTFLEKKPSVSSLSQRHPRPKRGANVATPATPLRRYSALRTNLSSRGARVEFDAPAETLTAGEIVFLQPPGSHWQVALVRWTRVTRTLSRVLGVEVLAEAALPCAVARTTPVGAGEEQFFPGLIYDADEGQRLVLPILPFKAYSSVKVLAGKRCQILRLKERVEATFHLSIFVIESAPKA